MKNSLAEPQWPDSPASVASMGSDVRLAPKPTKLAPYNPSGGMQFKTREELAILYKNLNEAHKRLLAKDDLHIFREPVTDDIAPQYSQLIRQPMDFGTMERKLNRKEYKNMDDYQSDFKLICNNCQEYNGENSDFGRIAKKLFTVGASQKNSIMHRCRKAVQRDLKELAEKIKKFGTATPGPKPSNKRKNITDGFSNAKRKNLGSSKSGLSGAARAVVVLKRPLTAEEIARRDQEAAMIVAQAQQAAQAARGELAKAKPKVLGIVRRNNTGLNFCPLDSIKSGNVQTSILKLPATSTVGIEHTTGKVALSFLHNYPQYSHDIRKDSVAWNDGKSTGVGEGEDATRDRASVALTRLGPPYFDNEVQEYVESLRAMVDGIGSDTLAAKKATRLIDRITMKSLTTNPEELEMPEPRTIDKTKEKDPFPKDLRDKKAYYEVLRDAVPVIKFLNEQLKRRISANQTLIPSEEVNTAQQLVKAMIELQKFKE